METIMTLPVQSQPKKIRTGTIAAIVSGVAALIGGYFVFLYKDKENKTLWQKWTSGDEDKRVEDIVDPSEAPPSGISKWTAETFPLKKGMFGGQVKNLQTALGIGDDGKFGSGTESKVMAKFGSPSVTKAQYDSLVNPKASGGGSNFSLLTKAIGNISKNTKDGLDATIQGANTNYVFRFYTNGRLFIYKGSKELHRGSYSDGGKRIIIDKGRTFSGGGASVNITDIVKWIDAGSKPMPSGTYFG
jgi:hypothetical protein